MADEPTAFLYPFIESDERDVSTLLAALATSARTKMTQSADLRQRVRREQAETLTNAGNAMADRFGRGGRLFTFGNGGSAADADAAAARFGNPAGRVGIAAHSLVADTSVVTALANDVGFDLVFARQLIARGRPDDVAMGFSTSGDSGNVLHALAQARERGLLTVGFAGYQGGAMVATGAVDHCFVVPSDSVHRIQETHQALIASLQRVVEERLGRAGVDRLRSEPDRTEGHGDG